MHRRGLLDSRNINLLRELTLSQYKLRDQSTFFGLLWSFANPLFMVLVLYTVFSKRFGEGISDYGIYLLLGMVQYTYFANATSTSMRAPVAMRALTKETVFPKELLVFSSALTATIDFVIGLCACIVVAYVTGVAPAWSQFWLPVLVLLQFLLVLWVSLLLACVHPFTRDIDHIYAVLLRALLFVTPIFYAKSFLGDGPARYLVTFNPLASLIEQSRRVLLEGTSPGALALPALVLANAVLVWLSWRLFKRIEPRLAESL